MDLHDDSDRESVLMAPAPQVHVLLEQMGTDLSFMIQRLAEVREILAVRDRRIVSLERHLDFKEEVQKRISDLLVQTERDRDRAVEMLDQSNAKRRKLETELDDLREKYAEVKAARDGMLAELEARDRMEQGGDDGNG